MWIIYAENFLNLLIFKFRRSLGLGIPFCSRSIFLLSVSVQFLFTLTSVKHKDPPSSSFVDHYTTRCDRLVTET